MNNKPDQTFSENGAEIVADMLAYGAESREFLREAKHVGDLAARYEDDIRIFSLYHPIGIKARDKAPKLRAVQLLLLKAAEEVAVAETARAEARVAEEYKRGLVFSQTHTRRGENVEIPGTSWRV